MSPPTHHERQLLDSLLNLTLVVRDHYPAMSPTLRLNFLDFLRRLHDLTGQLLAAAEKLTSP